MAVARSSCCLMYSLTSFEETEDDSKTNEGLPVLDETDGKGRGSPKDGNRGQKVPGADPSEQQVGWELEDDVCRRTDVSETAVRFVYEKNDLGLHGMKNTRVAMEYRSPTFLRNKA